MARSRLRRGGGEHDAHPALAADDADAGHVPSPEIRLPFNRWCRAKSRHVGAALRVSRLRSTRTDKRGP
jgi:hypothetical protein